MNVSITLPVQGDHNIQYNHTHDLLSPCSLSLFKPRLVCMQYIDKVDFKGIIYCLLSLSVATALSTSILSSLSVTLISIDGCSYCWCIHWYSPVLSHNLLYVWYENITINSTWNRASVKLISIKLLSKYFSGTLENL